MRARSFRSVRLLAIVASLGCTATARAEAAGDDTWLPCRDTDVALSAVANLLAAKKIANETASLTEALRRAGGSYVHPRALVLSGKRIEPTEARSRAAVWLQSLERTGQTRCVGRAGTAAGDATWAFVAVDAALELVPLPVRVRVGAWVTVEATSLVPAHGAKVIVLGPSGPPRPVPTSFSGRRLKARANLDEPGAWLVQVLIDGDGGPRPAIETIVFAGVEPWSVDWAGAAPGEEANAAGHALRATDADRLARMIDRAREGEGLPPLDRDETLDLVAQKHAERMMRTKTLAHDVRDGDPVRRVESAHVAAREVGENVAHASNLRLAHRALWGSPSHRGNLLAPRFGRVGLGIARDEDGTLRVTELFVTAL